LEYARQAVDAWLQLRSEFSGGKSGLSGEVRVFGSVTASYSMLTRILPGMRESHLGVELKLRTGRQADGIERVLTGAQDGAIIAKPDRLSPRLAFSVPEVGVSATTSEPVGVSRANYAQCADLVPGRLSGARR
jgi:LysR family positive regulator for ilvC